jgi:hypothetical protein
MNPQRGGVHEHGRGRRQPRHARGCARRAVDSLAPHDGPVILVDAGSCDGTIAAVRAAHPGVEVVALDNVGYGQERQCRGAATP